MELISLIGSIRETDRYIETIFMNGGCYRFHLFIKSLYPDAVPVKNKPFDHVGSLVDGTCYDINGIVDWDYFAMSDDDIKTAAAWSFGRDSFLTDGECAACGEPILLEGK
ncbi:hypothetical protein [Rosistilla oblonga]|uniref:hypothetical protein n=1 Tax=Rosistilla oblonga TaxID=2527990 RepID=UPI003A97C377